MMTEEAKSKLDQINDEAAINYLKEKIEEGRWAERLSINSDWLKIKEEIEKTIQSKEERKIKIYDSILESASTLEQKLKAWDEIMALKLEIENFRFFVSLPERKAAAGREAEKEKELIEKER